MQLEAPALVIAVLEMKSLSEGRRQRDLATIFAYGTAQGTHGIVALAPRRVVPASDRAGRETDVAPGHGMRPGLLGKRADRRLKRSRAGGELKSKPTTENRKRAQRAPVELGVDWIITPPHERVEGTVTIRFHRPNSVGEEHLLRIGGDHGEILICRPPGTVMGERNRKRCIHPSHGG